MYNTICDFCEDMLIKRCYAKAETCGMWNEARRRYYELIISKLSNEDISYFKEIACLCGFIFCQNDSIGIFISKVNNSLPVCDLREMSKNAIGIIIK